MKRNEMGAALTLGTYRWSTCRVSTSQSRFAAVLNGGQALKELACLPPPKFPGANLVW